MLSHSHRHNVIEFSAPDGAGPGRSAIDRFWAVAVIAVLAGWGGASYYMFTSMGWLGRGITVSIVAVVALMAVMFVRTGSRSSAAHEAVEVTVGPVDSQRAA